MKLDSDSFGADGALDASVALPSAGALLELLPFPAALWQQNRAACVFNKNTRQLLGFSESDFAQRSFQWMDRIHPQDRDEFANAWHRIEIGEKTTSCQYRFLPRDKEVEIRMREFLFSYPGRPGGFQTVWSVYVQNQSADEDLLENGYARNLVAGLTHEIANSLQSIRGEVDLLRSAGALSPQSASAVTGGIEHIHQLAREVNEYLSPFPFDRRRQNTVAVIDEVIRSSSPLLAERGIRISTVFNGPLPELALGLQFRTALKRVIEFSSALLPEGGELRVEVGVTAVNGFRYVEVRVINLSPKSLDVEEKDVFRPYLKVNDCRVGLTLAMARQILRSHSGKIIFQKERQNRGVFSILINIPEDARTQ